MNLKDIYNLAKPVVEVVEAVGSAKGATGQQKHDTATKILAEHVNDQLELPEYVEENTDAVLGMIVDLVVWGFNELRKGWEKDTPDLSAQVDPEALRMISAAVKGG